MLSNLQPRKLNRNYVEKFVTLLNQSKSLKPPYSVQRRKLKLDPIKNNKITNNKNINGNGIYVTKLDDNAQYQSINTYDNNKDEYSISISQIINDEEQNKIDNYNSNILSDTVKNLISKNPENNLDLELYQQKEKLLFEKLRTKNKFNLKSNSINNNRLYSSTEVNNRINNHKYSNQNSLLKIKNFLSPKFVKNFDESLGKSMEKNNIKKLTKNQMKKLYYISELKLFDSFDKIRKKNKILNQMKNFQKKKYLDNYDIFQYDKEKWERKRKELNKNINEIMFQNFDSENKQYLSHMRQVVDKLHNDKNYIEKDIGKFLNDLNNFIDKNSEYLKENNPSNKGSRLHSKRGSFSIKIGTGLKNSKILPSDEK